MKCWGRLILICFVNCILNAQNVKQENTIDINLDSEKQILQAMEEIKSANLEDYKILEQQMLVKDPEFKARLHNRLYALRHKQRMDAIIPKRDLGYHEKIKESSKRVEYLLSLYPRLTKPEEKIQWEKRLQEAAEARFLIEVEFKKKQMERLEKQLDDVKKSLAVYESKKDEYISRFVSKTKSQLKK